MSLRRDGGDGEWRESNASPTQTICKCLEVRLLSAVMKSARSRKESSDANYVPFRVKVSARESSTDSLFGAFSFAVVKSTADPAFFQFSAADCDGCRYCASAPAFPFPPPQPPARSLISAPPWHRFQPHAERDGPQEAEAANAIYYSGILMRFSRASRRFKM